MKLRILLFVLTGTSLASSNEEDVCATPLQNESDPTCKGEFRKWAFNNTSQKCERFMASACNRDLVYDSKYECMSNCDKTNPLLRIKAPPTDFCFYLPIKGTRQCLDAKRSWTFDVSAPGGPRCVKYTYGGCAGTENLFSSKPECLAACGDAVRKIKRQCPSSKSVMSCGNYCYGDSDCDKGEICCPSQTSECGAQCVPRTNAVNTFHNNSFFALEERKNLTLKTRAICEKPSRAFPCFATKNKFAFRPEKNRREVSLYGDCGSSTSNADNNFDSASECQKTCDVACAFVQCDTDYNRHYAYRNCIPQYSEGACCPTSYSCPDDSEISASESYEPVCFYKGHTYKPGASVPLITESEPCLECQCISARSPSKPFISCSRQTCPPLEDPPSPECILIHVPGQCCAQWKCEKTKRLVTCKANNETYNEGEVFYATPCRKCICTIKYTGEKGYGCSDVVCVEMPPSPDCIPIYQTDICCPVNFHCPTTEVPSIPTPPPDNTSSLQSSAEYEEAHAGVTTESLKSEINSTFVETKPPEEDICQLPKKEGPCQGYVPSFYYDSVKDTCERFLYGGCNGNGNRFRTYRECTGRCVKQPEKKTLLPEVCSLPMVDGDCRALMRRFFFNSTSKKCETFNYGGCGGNDNRFFTLPLCEAECRLEDVAEVGLSAQSTSQNEGFSSTESALQVSGETSVSNMGREQCKLPKDTGSCDQSTWRFYYNHRRGKCEGFVYGGCEGNANNYYTIDECEKRCGKSVAWQGSGSKELGDTTNTIKHHCVLPADPGFCLSFKPRFYYDPYTKSCEKFIYGGCKGNANNFRTEQECINSCGMGARETAVIPSEESACRFGNTTIQLGENLPATDICLDCTCRTPPDLVCSITECPEKTEKAIVDAIGPVNNSGHQVELPGLVEK